MLLLVFKCLKCLAPPYLCELVRPRTPVRALRSIKQLFLVVPRTKPENRGDRAFLVAAPRLANSLPFNIRTANTLEHFKVLLKICFSHWLFVLVEQIVKISIIHSFTYLIYAFFFTASDLLFLV